MAAETRQPAQSDNGGYDPATYVEADLFGEEDTRSNLMRLVSRRLTKIINIPNMKDHGATGVTGCLKNIAYGSFSNVARTHYQRQVAHLVLRGHPGRGRAPALADGPADHGRPARGVARRAVRAHAAATSSIPKQILFGTDPVAIDRLLLDVIDDKRKAEGAISIWDRSPRYLKMDDAAARDRDPNVNIIIREPGHVEFASSLGLGVYDRAKIDVQEIEV